MNLRYLIREIIEQKSIFVEAQNRFNKLTSNDLKFAAKNEFQYVASVSKKNLGVFSIFLNKVEVLMSIFDTGSSNYSITFQVFWEFSDGTKKFICNLNTLKVFDNKYSWIKNK